MCVPLRNFEVLIVIIKKLDNGRKETTNHLVIYALQEGNSEGGGGGRGGTGRGETPILGGFARKRYHFQASGTRGRDFSP